LSLALGYHQPSPVAQAFLPAVSQAFKPADILRFTSLLIGCHARAY
jgi:hypothetical protein